MSNKETQNQTSTQSVVRAPYGGGEPALQQGLSDALTMYRGGTLSPYFGLNANTQQGLSKLTSAADAGAPALSSALDTYQRQLNPEKGYAELNLGDVASGKFLDQEDPNYRQMIDRATERATTGVNMMAGARGRYGSDFHQGTLAREVGDIEASYGYQRLQDEKARQMAAIGAMDAGRENRLNRGMAAASAIPGAYQATLMPGQTYMDVGGVLDADRKEREGSQAQNLAALMALLRSAEPYGSANTVGNATGTTQKPTNWAGIVGGGGLTLASLLG